MIFADGFFLSVLESRVARHLGKAGLHIGGQGGLMVLHRPHLMSLVVHHNGPLAAHGITGHHTAGQVQLP